MLIKLTFNQFIQIGVYLGHMKSKTNLYASWVFGSWRVDFFIFSLYKTLIGFKIALKAVMHCAFNKRGFWFISLHKHLSSIITHYGLVCGEAVCSYGWIDGTLTNFKRIFGWLHVLLRLLKMNKYKFRYKDKRFLTIFSRLLFNRGRTPGLSFISNVIESKNVVIEFLVAKISTICIVDSNIESWYVSIPIAGNDDSVFCINFYSYLISKILVIGKLKNVDKWYKLLNKYKSQQFQRKEFFFLILFNSSKVNLNFFLKKSKYFLNWYKLGKEDFKNSYDNYFLKNDFLFLLNDIVVSQFNSVYSDKERYPNVKLNYKIYKKI